VSSFYIILPGLNSRRDIRMFRLKHLFDEDGESARFDTVLGGGKLQSVVDLNYSVDEINPVANQMLG